MTDPTKDSVELSTGKRYTSTELVEGYLDWMLTKKRRCMSPMAWWGLGPP